MCQNTAITSNEMCKTNNIDSSQIRTSFVFSMDGGEESLVKDAEVDITLLSKHLPDDYKTARLTEVVKSGLNDGEALANLYLQRCFHIVHEEYVELGKVEEQIKNIEGDF